MVEKKECYYEKNVSGVHENTPSTSLAHKPSTPPHMPFSSISNVESVHVEAPNMSNANASKLANVEAQAMAWKLHNCLSISWGFFVVDDGLLVDLVKPQMLQCIICKYKQTSNDVLAQIFAICNHLIKYNNVIGIIPMIIYVQIAHPRLFS
jgi:hypothetical protein